MREAFSYDLPSMWDDGYGSDTEDVYRRLRELEEERRIDEAWERYCEAREAGRADN